MFSRSLLIKEEVWDAPNGTECYCRRHHLSTRSRTSKACPGLSAERHQPQRPDPGAHCSLPFNAVWRTAARAVVGNSGLQSKHARETNGSFIPRLWFQTYSNLFTHSVHTLVPMQVVSVQQIYFGEPQGLQLQQHGILWPLLSMHTVLLQSCPVPSSLRSASC